MPNCMIRGSAPEEVILKRVLDPELQDARVARLRLDPPKRAAVDARGRITPIEVVEHVEDLEPELHRVRDESREREVRGPEPGALDAVPHRIAKGAWRRCGKGRDVQIVVQCLVAVGIGEDLIGPLAADPDASRIGSGSDTQPAPGSRADNPRY